MAKKKTSSHKKKKQVPVEIMGILYIVFTVLGLLRSGFVGKLVSNFGIFLFGSYYNWGITYFLIVGLYVILFREKPKLFKRKLVGFYLIAIALLSMSHIKYIMYNTNIGSVVFQDTIANVVSGFNDVSFIQGGGIIGAIFSYIFVLAFDVLGSKIMCFVLILFGAMLIFNLSPATLLKKILLIFIPKKWLVKKDEDEEDTDEEEDEKQEETPKKKRVVISNINDLSKVNINEDEDKIPIVQGEYNLPPISLLNVPKKVNTKANEESISSNIKLLEQVLADFDITGTVVAAHVGPTVTQYELEVKSGTKVSKILSLNKEIALALAAKDVRIQAPIPGKSTIGVDIPNKIAMPVSLREVLAEIPSELSDKKLLAVLGKDIMGNPMWMEINKTPHLLIAGATGSGKSVCVNSVITTILMRAKPDEVKLVMIDPKKVELSMYNGAPHLLCPVVTDAKKASVALKKIVEEMERRYELFSESGTKNIEGYNKKIVKNESDESKANKLPYIVVLIDELADLMLVAAKEVEDSIMRITQMARAAGIHLIVATQRPSTDVITGVVKANIPSRISFAVSSQIDSRTILDMGGAEKLLGKGDMLFLPMGEGTPTRIQGSFISEEEVQKIVNYTIKQRKAEYSEAFSNLNASSSSSSTGSYNDATDADDPLYNEVVEFVIKSRKVSASLLQRKYRLGYNRAARMVDLLEDRGIIGPANGSKPREVLVELESDDNEEE